MSRTIKDIRFDYLDDIEKSKRIRSGKKCKSGCNYCMWARDSRNTRSTRERLAYTYELSAYDLLTATEALQLSIQSDPQNLTTTTKEAN